MNFTALAEVGRIAALTDPVARNHQITQSYHELSLAMAKRLGPVANWCTFATWASRQAGQSIRKEDLANALSNKLQMDGDFLKELMDAVNGSLPKKKHFGRQEIEILVREAIDPRAVMDRAGKSVAKGNQKVFAEIAVVFARFVAECINDPTFDTDQIDWFCHSLRPGDSPDGQQYLRQAFAHYYQAIFETNPKQKAELILLANLECGFHEQTRLQPEIQTAMEAGVVEEKLLKEKLIGIFLPKNSWIDHIRDWFYAIFNRPTPLDQTVGKFSAIVRLRIRLFLTAHLMELGFPKGMRLPLGKDLRAHIPTNLQQITHPELLALLLKIDPTPNDLAQTGASDWAELFDRLHFIGDLFRCYQEREELLGPP